MTVKTFSDVASVTPGDAGNTYIFVGPSLGAWRLPSLASVPRGFEVGLQNSGPADVQAIPRAHELIEGLVESASYTHPPASGALYIAQVSLWRQAALFQPGGVPIGGVEGQVLRKLSAVNYDDQWQDSPMSIPIFLPGTQGSSAIARVLMTEAGSFPADFTGSFALAKTSSAGTATFTIKVNATTIGTGVFATSTTGTLSTSGGTAKSFVAGDFIEFVAPASPDASLADIAFGLRAIRA
jgi:hypothetical protein